MKCENCTKYDDCRTGSGLTWPCGAYRPKTGGGMDIEKLIEQLRTESLYADKASLEIMDLCMDAATALSALQAENEKLRAGLDDLRIQWDMYGGDVGITAVYKELEQVKAERDAAVKDLNEFLAMDELCPIQCEWCKWKDTFCDGKTPEWRGIKED